MATNNMHNLTTLIKRLEAATSRLEDIASSAQSFEQPSPTGHHGGPSDSSGLAVPSQGQIALQTPSTHTPGSSQTQLADPLSQSIMDFDALLRGDLQAYSDLSEALGGVLAEQARAVVGAFEAQREFLLITTKAKRPEMDSAVMDLLKDLQEEMTKVQNVRENNRGSPLKDHLAMVADGVDALGWITIDPKPAEYVVELFGGAQMFGNKVLKEFKDRDEAQVEWVKSFYKLMRSLISYIKEHYIKGLQWNAQGMDAAEVLHQVQSTPNGTAAGFGSVAPPPPPMPAGGIPPPPGPPPPPSLGGPPKAAAPDMGAVFQQLNQGEAVTKGLKKVDPSQQTHKNPSLRAQAPVPTRSDSRTSLRGKSPTPPGKKPKPESMRAKKPPRRELDGNKWIIENFEDHPAPVEIITEINHSILITRCKNTTIRVNGKGNAISIDNSPKTSIIIDSLVSSVDVIKCANFALQVLETVPTILLDQVDGATVYLSKDSLNTEIMTSKCTSVNVYLPPETEDGDYKEQSVPEQFRSYVKNGKLVTEIVEHVG